jgi:protein-tyrosine phosphatase
MHGLTPHDYATLEKIGIRVVCDLRDNRERAAEPAAWPEPGAPLMLTQDYLLDYRTLMPAGPINTWTAESARAGLAASYPRMLAQFNGQYRRMFAQLVAGQAPLAFHCSAGKDRTGIAAALVLTALGVPRQTVIDDYLLTNQTLDTAALMAGKASGPMAGLPPAVQQAFLAADRSYIEAALAVVDAHRDGAPGYLRDELGVGPAEIAQLRKLYLD